MRHYHRLNDVHIDQSWVTIGIFDGVHIGHQRIIKELVGQARDAGVSAGVITFYPHPVEVIRELNEPIYITSPESRAALLGALGVDFVLTIKFTKKISNQSPEEFLSSLDKHLGIKGLFTGSDFVLGKNRTGTVEKLRSIGSQMGFFVKEFQKVTEGQATVSSSLIRQQIIMGRIRQANQMLGRYFSLDGIVTTGESRGKTLGIPTANIIPWEKQILPPNGVYATIANVKNKRFKSVTNVGVKPTFKGSPAKAVVEAFIMDFNEDIYGQNLSLEFVEHLREERKFDSPQALVEQIQKDIQQANEVLGDSI